MGKDEKAKEYLLKCLAYYKELPEANYYMAMIYKRENNAELRSTYMEIAKLSISKGFGLNEDNVYYANYPHEITLSDIDNELAK